MSPPCRLVGRSTPLPPPWAPFLTQSFYTGRHTLASAAVHILESGVAGDFEVERGGKPEKEITVLSKCVSAIPTKEEWRELMSSPGPAEWPEPEEYVPAPKVAE